MLLMDVEADVVDASWLAEGASLSRVANHDATKNIKRIA